MREKIYRFAKLMVVFATIVIFVGIGAAIRSYFYISSAVSGKATIVELRKETNPNDDTMYAPVITFHDNKGILKRVVYSVASSPPIGKVGEEIEILFDPQNSDNVEVKGTFDQWGGAIIIGVCGVLGFVFFLLVMIISRTSKGPALKRTATPSATPDQPSR